MLRKYLFPFSLFTIVFISFGFFPLNNKADKSINISLIEEAINEEGCSYNGFPLYGKIQFVENFPDIKVQVVEHFPDLKVKLVDHFPDDCGEWKVVNHFPDVKVQLVENFPDVKVKFVENFPGIP